MSALGWISFLLAAGAGAVGRFLLSGAIQRRVGSVHPWGAFTVNASGCLAAGVVAGVVLGQPDAPEWATVVAIGGLGSFTTFSTLAFEAVRLFEEGERRVAVLDVGGTMLAGAAGAAIGVAVGSAW